MRPRRHNLCDLFLAHLFLCGGALLLPRLALGGHLRLHGAFLVTQLCRALKVLMRDGLILFLFKLGALFLHLLHIGRRDEGLNAHAGCRLVDQVNRLIRQEAVGDVTVGQLHGGSNGIIGDAHLVMRLVAVAQTL